jgi:hypothetical protein
MLRLFLDGIPAPSMLAELYAARDRLTPRLKSRWPDDADGREALFRAAFESGYDTAMLKARDDKDSTHAAK